MELISTSLKALQAFAVIFLAVLTQLQDKEIQLQGSINEAQNEVIAKHADDNFKEAYLAKLDKRNINL